MDPFPAFTRVGREQVDECSHVVVRHGFAFGYLLGCRNHRLVGGLRRRVRSDTLGDPGVDDQRLDPFPHLEAMLVGPDLRHFWEAVPGNHDGEFDRR